MQPTNNPYAKVFKLVLESRGGRKPKGPNNDAQLEGLAEGMESDSSRGAIARLGAKPRSNIFGGKG